MKAKNNKKQMAFRVLSILMLTFVLAFTVTTPAFAGVGIEGDPDATIEAGQTVKDDLFIGGRDVVMAGTVEGDLFAAGETVVISGVVEGNVFAAGQSVTVSGEIQGVLILAGYDLTLEDGATIARNVYFGGFSLMASPESVVGRSLYGGGYQLMLDGQVVRDVTAGLGAIEINGPVGGDVYVELGEPDDPNFVINFWDVNVPYVEALEPGDYIDENMVDGVVNVEVTPVHTDINVDAPDFHFDPAWFVMQWFRRRTGEFIGLLLVGALLLWLGKDLFLKAHAEIQSNAGKDTLWGLLVYFLYIPALVLLFTVLLTAVILLSLVTLGSLTGKLIAVSSLTFVGFTTLFGIVTSLVTKALVGYLVGRWLLSKMTKMSYESFWHHFAALAFGVFLYEMLVAIPVFGWFVTIVVVLIGTGALFVLARNALRKDAPLAPVDAVAAE